MADYTINETSFEYTYSAAQQDEILKIRNKYLPKKESKLEQMRRLDKSAERAGTQAGIIVGVIGSLLMGIGMSCSMVWKGVLFIPGIAIGICGLAMMAAGYPLYKKITKKQREKIAEQILELSNDLIIS